MMVSDSSACYHLTEGTESMCERRMNLINTTMNLYVYSRNGVAMSQLAASTMHQEYTIVQGDNVFTQLEYTGVRGDVRLKEGWVGVGLNRYAAV